LKVESLRWGNKGTLLTGTSSLPEKSAVKTTLELIRVKGW
jgi:hypothetical protein